LVERRREKRERGGEEASMEAEGRGRERERQKEGEGGEVG
jgi:hypothetical protein